MLVDTSAQYWDNGCVFQQIQHTPSFAVMQVRAFALKVNKLWITSGSIIITLCTESSTFKVSFILLHILVGIVMFIQNNSLTTQATGRGELEKPVFLVVYDSVHRFIISSPFPLQGMPQSQQSYFVASHNPSGRSTSYLLAWRRRGCGLRPELGRLRRWSQEGWSYIFLETS